MALSELVPPQTLRHRVVDWLDRGCAATNGKLWRLRRAGRGTNFLVLAGGDDRFLPSASEAARLKKELPGCEAVILPRGGHAVLADDKRLDLSVALRKSRALYGAELRAAKALAIARQKAEKAASRSCRNQPRRARVPRPPPAGVYDCTYGGATSPSPPSPDRVDAEGYIVTGPGARKEAPKLEERRSSDSVMSYL